MNILLNFFGQYLRNSQYICCKKQANAAGRGPFLVISRNYFPTAFTRMSAAALIKFYDFFHAALIRGRRLLKLIERNDSG